MPSKFRVRRIFKGLVWWIARPLARAGARPNTITYFSLLLALLAALVLNLTGSHIVFGILVFLSGLFDHSLLFFIDCNVYHIFFNSLHISE